MKKSKFEKMIGHELTERDYSIVELVAKYHPAINGDSIEEKMCTLYKEYGMDLIRNMSSIAYDMRDLYEEEDQLINKLIEVNSKMDDICNRAETCVIKSSLNV